MAIRLREINGFMIALCAVESDPKKGDIYLDDNAHHALTTKFSEDFRSMGYVSKDISDTVLVELMKKEKVRDSEEEMVKWHNDMLNKKIKI